MPASEHQIYVFFFVKTDILRLILINYWVSNVRCQYMGANPSKFATSNLVMFLNFYHIQDKRSPW